MVITEATVINWLSVNYPSVLIGLSAAIIYVVAYLRLKAFFDRMEKMETELTAQKRELVRLKSKLSQLILSHCQQHKDDLKELMQEKKDE
jgi:hypothetical protein